MLQKVQFLEESDKKVHLSDLHNVNLAYNEVMFDNSNFASSYKTMKINYKNVYKEIELMQQ